MPSSSNAPPASAGRRKLSVSPTSSVHPSPSLNPSVPRIKLSLRSTTPLPSRQNDRTPRPRRHHADQRQRHPFSSGSDSDSSDLTPAEDDDRDDEQDSDVEEISPRRKKGDVTPTSKKGLDKGKGRASDAKKKASGSGSKVTITGPLGRERKRNVKLGEQERRRARDEKFGMGDDGYGGVTPTQSSRNVRALVDSDATSSFGDDESDHGNSVTHGLGHESDDEETRGLPEAFAGQEIEDLAYGAGPAEIEVEREALSGWWEDEEDDEMFISHLSGSEAEQQSQSSANGSDSDDPMSDSDYSTDGDVVDEFGFPIPHAAASEGAADQGLVLMQNWDGEFVLVQPRHERSRSRRGERSSRAAGSVSGSTVISSGEQQGLLIDPDAVGHEFDEESEWSGNSDEDDGDTTDSMAEEDMPMLDSPALQELIEQQVGMGPNPNLAGLIEAVAAATTPAIVVTDTSNPETPALSTTSTATPNLSLAGPPAMPQTPAAQPVMGTFHPTTDDPAQHAVIDGSKTATKSPFTHRRRSRKGRADSMSSARTSTTTGAGAVERKRRSTAHSADPFAPIPRVLPKKARYSSIPGHPRYIAAQRAFIERESTPSEEGSGGIELEDMLETSVLVHDFELPDSTGADEHLRHLIRFDRVPVSSYLRRNFGGRERYADSTGGTISAAAHAQLGGAGVVDLGMGMPALNWSSPMRGGAEDTLAGPMGRMLVSPVLLPQEGERKGRRGRRMEALKI